jgi:HD-GYP domain-containing protein (c-di-GMP phosphodiesterase class II)
MCDPGLQLVFLLDELELATTNPDFDLNFFSALRSLAAGRGLAFVTATERSLYRLAVADRKVGSPFAGLFATIALGPLSPEAVKALIDELSRRAGVSLAGQAKWALQVSGGWPWELRHVCSHLLDQARESPKIGQPERDFAWELFLREIEPRLAYRWERLEPAARAAALEIVQSAEPAQSNASHLELLEEEGILLRQASGRRVAQAVWKRFLEDRLRERERGADEFLVANAADKLATGRVQAPADKSVLYAVMRTLVRASEARIPFARGHSDGTALLAAAIASKMGCDTEACEEIRLAARLHDVGSISISDLILLKPGKLTATETEIVQAHPLVGAHLLDALDFPWPVKLAVRLHHERLDGSGYPEGLQGEEIPLAARILAVADSYQAMTSARPFRAAYSEERAATELASLAPEKYDPAAVRALFSQVGKGEPAAASGARKPGRPSGRGKGKR